MKVFFFRHIGGLVDDDILAALKEMKIEIDIQDINFITKDKISDYDVSNIEYKIKKFQPDLLFSTNDMALDSKGKLLDLYKKLGIDLGCWFVDEPGFTFSEPWLSIFRHDLIKLFMIDRSWVESAKSVGISNVRHLPLATNIDRFKSSGFTEYDNNERFESDITFVGSLGADKIKYFLNHIKNMNLPNFSRFVELINAAGERYLNDYKTSIEDHLYKIIHESHTDLKELIFDADKNGLLKSVYFLIDFMASFKKRKDIVTSLVDLGITVYGEKEWENFIPKECMGNLPGTNENFPINYYGNELAKIYYRSKINVNVTKFQLKTAVNQRVFDVPAGGGFLLTDYREDLDMLFETGDEIIVYNGIDDLREKAEYYLNHPAERQDIVLRAQKRIVKEHDYKHRLSKLFTSLEKFVN